MQSLLRLRCLKSLLYYNFLLFKDGRFLISNFSKNVFKLFQTLLLMRCECNVSFKHNQYTFTNCFICTDWWLYQLRRSDSVNRSTIEWHDSWEFFSLQICVMCIHLHFPTISESVSWMIFFVIHGIRHLIHLNFLELWGFDTFRSLQHDRVLSLMDILTRILNINISRLV